MGKRIPRQTMALYLLCGMVGCLLMASSDWLMIYGNTAAQGALAWLTEGVAQIPAWRNTLAMVLAFPAVVCYLIALLGVRHFLRDLPAQQLYIRLTALGMTPWLCLHLFYTMILFLFGWLRGQGELNLALSACEALFGHFAWLVPAADVFMVLPFLYLLFAFVTDRTAYPRWVALNNPLVIFAVLKLLTGFLPDVPARLAFLNGLMSESMLIWFLVFLLAQLGKKNRLY